MNNLVEQVMHNIKEDKIKPLSRWKIVTKNFLLLFLAILLVVLGILATSFIIYNFDYADWDVYKRLPWRDFWWASFGSLPYIWLIVFGLFAFLAVRQFRKQGTAYRYSLLWILGPIVAISLTGGAVAYYSGLQTVMREHMSASLRFSNILFPHPAFVWDNPSQGRLSGAVIERKGESIIIVDNFQNLWHVTCSGCVDLDDVDKADLIKLLGKQTGQSQFTAFEVREFFRGRHEPHVRFIQMMPPVQR